MLTVVMNYMTNKSLNCAEAPQKRILGTLCNQNIANTDQGRQVVESEVSFIKHK